MAPRSTEQMDFVNEFASIRLTREVGRCGVRLKVTDLETSATTYINPLELASLCDIPVEDRTVVVSGPMYRYGTEEYPL